MNKHLHRIIFNASRGMRMVVQETAKSAGKATGATSAVVASALVSLLATSPASPAHAQIAASPLAPTSQRAAVLLAPNGVPLVNIATPSTAGVSHNTYSQFNVGANGVILNNSRTSVQTQLGGYVQGNPFLATGPARIILTEVNGGSTTQLRGYLEVAGQRAEIIIANPAGISVDGGGTINASRLTLTTGTPQLNALGGLDSFLVRGGTVTIDGAGLDASTTDYAAILARAVNVNAAIYATDLKVVTGANQVSADHSQVTPTAGTGAAPTFALDVSALGGMYAGKIVLIGTDAGLGVRNAGSIGASAGTGAAGSAAAAATAYVPPTPGTITAGGTVFNDAGKVYAAGPVTLQTANLVNTGGAINVASMALNQPTFDNHGGTLNVSGVFSANVGQLDNAGGTLHASNLQIQTSGDLLNVDGTLTSDSDASLTVGGKLDNTRGTISATGPLTANVAGAVQNTSGSLLANQAVSVRAGSLDNTLGTVTSASVSEQSGIQAGDGGFQVNVAGNTNLVGGVIASTQGAVDANVNRFATGSLTTSNIVNHDTGSASGYSLSASYSGSQSGGLSQDGSSTTSSGIGGGVGFGHAGGSQTSVTTAGISGIGGNTAVRTGDSSNGLTRQYADAGALLGEVQTQVQITSAFTSTFGPVVADAAVSWLTALFAPTGATAVPTPGNPTPAATELVQGDQATRQGFATIQGDPTLSSDLKTFMLDLKTIYDNDAFVQDAVHQAVTDPLAYQMSLTGSDPNNPMVKVIFPAVAAAGAGSSAAAGGAAASLASAVATGGLKYDPVSDTYTSASGGVAPGAFVRALSNVSGTAIGLLDAGTAALVSALQTQLPFLGKLVVTVTAVAMNAANGDGGSGSGPAGGNQADTYGTPPNGASPPPDGDNRDSSAAAGEVRTVSIRNQGSSAEITTYEVNGQQVQINSGHGFGRPHTSGTVAATGLSQAEVETAIVRDVTSGKALPPSSSSGVVPTQTITVGEVRIDYRAVTLPNGRVAVSTYFPA